MLQKIFQNVLNKNHYNHKTHDRTCHKQKTQNFTKNYSVLVPQPLFQPEWMQTDALMSQEAFPQPCLT